MAEQYRGGDVVNETSWAMLASLGTGDIREVAETLLTESSDLELAIVLESVASDMTYGWDGDGDEYEHAAKLLRKAAKLIRVVHERGSYLE